MKRKKGTSSTTDRPARRRAVGGELCNHSLGAVSSPRRLRAVDLFCGIGGLSYGLRCRGIEVAAGYDVDASCRYAYEANNDGAAFIESDIRDLSFRDLAPRYCGADVSILVGCAPCQPFSAHTRRNKHRGDDCSLLDEFSRIVAEGTPDVVSIENVPGLSKHEAFARFVRRLRQLEYRVAYGVLNCGNYGVPQRRKRLVLLASRLHEVSVPPARGDTPPVANFIHDLPPLESGETHAADRAHVTLPLSRLNRRRILQSKPGGSWKDWDAHLVSECHQRAYYPAPYGRMRWDAPAPTMTTQFCYYSTGRFGHPEQNRTISVREAALLQTFPANYALVDPDATLPVRKLAKQIGNAVPVKLAEALGDAIWEAAGVE